LTRAQDPECRRSEPLVFQMQRQASARNGSALALTEFGASDDLVDIARVKADADAASVSWFFWQYQAWSDPTGNPGGEGLSTDDGAERFDTFKKAKVDLLTESYPQAIAGAPIAWGMHGATFRLTYAATRTDPALTEIYLDPFSFPGAVAVGAAGASPVACPAPRPHVVCVQNTTTAGTVTVVVTPA
jgi:hypothetical protein